LSYFWFVPLGNPPFPSVHKTGGETLCAGKTVKEKYISHLKKFHVFQR